MTSSTAFENDCLICRDDCVIFFIFFFFFFIFVVNNFIYVDDGIDRENVQCAHKQRATKKTNLSSLAFIDGGGGGSDNIKFQSSNDSTLEHTKCCLLQPVQRRKERNKNEESSLDHSFTYFPIDRY